ncbi:hypothetical protein FRC02_005360 [Tulasnella sp. 418]|nr:hypothetical protein FRC02_005360 [Tulasnella sp. 418]
MDQRRSRGCKVTLGHFFFASSPLYQTCGGGTLPIALEAALFGALFHSRQILLNIIPPSSKSHISIHLSLPRFNSSPRIHPLFACQVTGIMQHQGANDIHGVGVDIGEWSSNELPWLPQHPSLQPSPSYYPPVVAAAASGPSVYYPSPNPYDPRSIQPWHAVGQQAPLFPPQYHPTTSVPAVPLPHLTVPVLVHYPLTTDHLPTTSDADIFGSPTVVSRSPISAPHSPAVPPAPAINNSSNPKPATKSKGRRNWPCPECQKPFNRPSARDQVRMKFLHGWSSELTFVVFVLAPSETHRRET